MWIPSSRNRWRTANSPAYRRAGHRKRRTVRADTRCSARPPQPIPASEIAFRSQRLIASLDKLSKGLVQDKTLAEMQASVKEQSGLLQDEAAETPKVARRRPDQSRSARRAVAGAGWVSPKRRPPPSSRNGRAACRLPRPHLQECASVLKKDARADQEVRDAKAHRGAPDRNLPNKVVYLHSSSVSFRDQRDQALVSTSILGRKRC